MKTQLWLRNVEYQWIYIGEFATKSGAKLAAHDRSAYDTVTGIALLTPQLHALEVTADRANVERRLIGWGTG